MVLPGNVQAAPDGAMGFDADTRISANVAQQFVNQGYSFCVRYLSRGIGQAPGDLSAAEAGGILAAGLGLMAVQHVRQVGWEPNAALGQGDGTHAAGNAAAIGFPPGVNIWCDLEGVAGDAAAADVIGYCNAWFASVAARGMCRVCMWAQTAFWTGSSFMIWRFSITGSRLATCRCCPRGATN